MNSSSENSIEWQAFLYITDELSGDEAEKFEERLADDQAAREAVARVVEIEQAVVQAAGVKMPPVLPAEPRQRRIGWQSAVVGVVLAGLFLAMIPLMIQLPSNRQQQPGGPAVAEAESMVDQAALLVAVWTSGEQDTNDEEDWFDSEWCGPDADNHSGYAVLEIGVPTWMYEAVAEDDGIESGSLDEGPVEN